MAERTEVEGWDISRVLDGIGIEYSKSGQGEAWPGEKPGVERAIRFLANEIGREQEIKECIAVAGSRIVLRLVPRAGGAELALKICRPYDDAAQVVARESKTIEGLYHPNIIRIIRRFEVPKSDDPPIFELPATLEEYVPGGLNLEKWITRELSKALGDSDILGLLKRLRGYLAQLLEGVHFLHSNHVYHCDIKPENLLVDGTSLKVVDFGFAYRLIPGRYTPEGKSQTKVGFTWDFAWPELRRRAVSMSSPNAVIALEGPDFSFARADQYAVGRTIEDLVERVETAKQKLRNGLSQAVDTGRTGFEEDVDYFAAFLLLVAGRLKGEDSFGDSDHQGLISKYPREVVKEIQYWNDLSGLKIAKEDLDKLAIDTLAEIAPEWNRSLDDQLRVGNVNVPFTPRIRRLMNHPALTRLAPVSQLGLVSFVYPSARHSRLEHSLGTYAWACRYLEALWCQKGDPFFRCITHPNDIIAASLAALLHDLGQYPHCHDIEDSIPALRDHALESESVYHHSFPSEQGDQSLESIVRTWWSPEVADRVPSFLGKNKSKSPTALILWGVISGTIDADKLDYIQRDSLNLGIGYGSGIEAERLLLSLRPVVRASGPRQRTSVTLGVAPKGILPAHTIVVAREQLFERVYWHKTVRSFKAMLSAALRRGIVDLRPLEGVVQSTIYHPEIVCTWIPKDAAAESFHLPTTDAAILYRLKSLVESDEPSAYLIDQILRRHPYRPLLDLGLGEWKGHTDRATVAAALQPLNEVLSLSPGRVDLLEKARLSFQTLLFDGGYVHEIGPPDILSPVVDQVAVLIDVPREKVIQATLFVSGGGLEPEKEVDLSLLPGATEQGWVKSVVPRIYLNPRYRAEVGSAHLLVDLLREATKDLGRITEARSSPEQPVEKQSGVPPLLERPLPED